MVDQWRDPATSILLLDWRATLVVQELAKNAKEPDASVSQRVSKAVSEKKLRDGLTCACRYESCIGSVWTNGAASMLLVFHKDSTEYHKWPWGHPLGAYLSLYAPIHDYSCWLYYVI
jgi:hypothetical protein